MYQQINNKGITLIALVITIIVLVILVGVTVSVTINTGLIENSKKAVADYDKAQQYEEKVVLDALFTINAAQKNVDLDMRQGILIISPEIVEIEITNTVGEVLSGLPDGYSIGNENGEKIADNTTIVDTGMSVLDKENNILGRVAVLGELSYDIYIDSSDILQTMYAMDGIVEPKDHEKLAMDVNRDGKINQTDLDMIQEVEREERSTFPDEGYRGSIADIVIEELES